LRACFACDVGAGCGLLSALELLVHSTLDSTEDYLWVRQKRRSLYLAEDIGVDRIKGITKSFIKTGFKITGNDRDRAARSKSYSD
jgi:hypothetical protein